jgi:uncharacterized membrane protein (UPF0127 family)
MSNNHKSAVASFFVALVALSLPFFCSGCASNDFVDLSFPSGAKVNCKISASQEELTAGLTIYDTLAENQGMIFVYSEQRAGHSFWMPARMKFPIDFIFLNSEKQVVHIIRNAQPCKSNIPQDCPSYATPVGVEAQYVVEVVAGFCDKNGLGLRDEVEFKLP